MAVDVFQGGLKELLDRDSFYAPEVDIFQAVVDWAKTNGENNFTVSEMLSLRYYYCYYHDFKSAMPL